MKNLAVLPYLDPTTPLDDVVTKIPGMNQAKFIETANKAKTGCPVSKLVA